jgi:hypothetical protein
MTGSRNTPTIVSISTNPDPASAEVTRNPDQIARLTGARTAFDELAEAYEALRRMIERGYVALR